MGPAFAAPSEQKTGGDIYRCLDAWRGIAALMVVLFHASSTLAYKWPGPAAQAYARLGSQGYLGVELFYVISGYCIAVSLSNYQRKVGMGWHGATAFLRARAGRIFPPYWAAFALNLAVGAVMLRLGSGASASDSSLLARMQWLESPARLLSELSLTSYGVFGNCFLPFAWTLCYEIAFYAIVFVLALTLGRKGTAWVDNAVYGLIGLCALWLVLPMGRLGWPLDMWPLFGLGFLVQRIVRDPTARAPRVALAITSLLLLMQLPQANHRIGDHPAPVAAGVSLLFALTLLGLHRWDARLANVGVVRVLGTVGVFSYSLYLVHYLGMGIGIQLSKRLGVPAEALAVHFGLMVTISVLLGATFYALCERPLMRLRRTTKQKTVRLPTLPDRVADPVPQQI